jgi:hypothetical protein
MSVVDTLAGKGDRTSGVIEHSAAQGMNTDFDFVWRAVFAPEIFHDHGNISE